MQTDDELDEEMQALIEKEKASKEADASPEPQPEVEESEEQEASPQAPVETAPEEEKPEPTDDPLEWAKKKGLTTPEAIAKSYRELEQKVGRAGSEKGRNQNGYFNGYQGNPAPQPQPPMGWQPQPSYAPRGNDDVVKDFARRHQLDEEDVKRLLPAMVEVAGAINRQGLTPLQQELLELRNQTKKSTSLNQLMADPAFSNPLVVQEMHKAFESDPSLFQRDDGYNIAFNQAMANIARQQIQQTTKKKPPTTAGGGAGRTGPTPNAMKDFNSMTPAQQEAFLLKSMKNVPAM